MINWIEKYLDTVASSKSANTFKTNKSALQAWFPNNNADFTLDYISKRLKYLKRKYKPNTLAVRTMTLTKFIKFVNNFKAVKDLNVILDLLSSIKMKETVPVVVTQEQYKIIIQNCSNDKLRLAIRLMYENALRESELLNIRTEDYNYQNKTICLKNTKNHNDYLIYLTDSLNEAIHNWYNPQAKYLFPSNTGTAIDAGNFRRYVKKLCTDCGFSELHCHSFRHGSATTLLDNNVNLFVIKEHLRHKSLQSTQRYLHISQKQREEVKNIFANI